MNLEISVVIPCYKTGDRIKKLTEEISLALGQKFKNQFELIFVVDGSPDETWQLVKIESTNHDFVRGINLIQNFGQHSAILAGVKEAKGKHIVTLDDDFQHNPSDIPKLLSFLSEEIDLVYGVSTVEEHSTFRNITSQTYKRIMSAILKIDGAKIVSGFRAFKSELVYGFVDNLDYFSPVDVMLSWSTQKSLAVPIEMQKRKEGKSNYTTRKLIKHALNSITGYSITPLRISSFLGIFSFLLSLIMLFYYLLQYFYGQITVDGFPTLVIMISMFSGVQLLSLGIIGEYIGKLSIRSTGKPRYVIKDMV